MQLYLDGNKNNFFTIFDVVDQKGPKIKNKNLSSGYNFLKNKSVKSVMIAQKYAVQRVFKKQGLKFRNFEILNKDDPLDYCQRVEPSSQGAFKMAQYVMSRL